MTGPAFRTTQSVILAFLVAASAGPTARAAEPPPTGGEVRGDEACAACHEQIAEAFAARNVHAKAKEYGKGEAGRACESCHGPGGRHVDSQDPNDVVNPAKASAADSSASCLTCHALDAGRAHWRGGAHEAADVACASCHSMHEGNDHPKLLARPTEAETCVSCHHGLRKTLLARSRHPLREGKMDCSSCHDPHGTSTEKMISAASVNDKCYECHAEKRGPFLWEHSPVRESCLNCHAPHGSNHDRMLVSQTTRLCQQCHIQGRHQTNPAAPNAVWVFNRACLNCHGAVHGTNSPSGVILQR